MLKKIHHIGIVVRSIDAAYAFYRDTLSLPVHKEDIIQNQGVKAALLTIGASEIVSCSSPLTRVRVWRVFSNARAKDCIICALKLMISPASFLAAARTKGVVLIDQHPGGLAGLICFLHPKASHGVLIEYAQPE